jgi:hypothetical protein
MTERTYLFRFKSPGLSTQPVTAASAEIQGDHIVLLDSHGKLVALFSMDIVESWSVIGIPQANHG